MLQRLFSILGSFLILLLILDDKPSDVPVRGKHLRVDATDDPPARGEDFLLAGIVCDGILDSKAISEGICNRRLQNKGRPRLLPWYGPPCLIALVITLCCQALCRR